MTVRALLAGWDREAAACQRLADEDSGVERAKWRERAEAIEQVVGDVRAALAQQPGETDPPCAWEYVGHGVCGLQPGDHATHHLGHAYKAPAATPTVSPDE